MGKYGKLVREREGVNIAMSFLSRGWYNFVGIFEKYMECFLGLFILRIGVWGIFLLVLVFFMYLGCVFVGLSKFFGFEMSSM